MSLLDNELIFSRAQAITADAGSTDVIDLRNAVGSAPGNEVRVIANIDQSFNNLTSLGFIVQTCADPAFGSGVVSHQTITRLLAQLTAGQRIDLGEVPDGALRYLRVFYDVTGTAPTLGQVTSFLEPLGSNQTIPGQA